MKLTVGTTIYKSLYIDEFCKIILQKAKKITDNYKIFLDDCSKQMIVLNFKEKDS